MEIGSGDRQVVQIWVLILLAFILLLAKEISAQAIAVGLSMALYTFSTSLSMLLSPHQLTSTHK